MDMLLEDYDNMERDRWVYCINHWGLIIACQTNNINSIDYMLNKKIEFQSYDNFTYIEEAIKNNNKYVLQYLTTINPFICYFSYKKKLGISNNSFLLNILELKIKLIQNWWKSIYYSPYTRIGKNRLIKEYDNLVII